MSGAVERAFPAIGRGIGQGLGPDVAPLPFVLSGDDGLRLTILNRSGPLRVGASARYWVAELQQYKLVTESIFAPDGTTTRDLRLPRGALMNVRMFPITAPILSGGLFVRAQLIQGVSTAATVIATLLQGYITAQNERAWPGTPLQSPLEGPGRILDGGWVLGFAPLRAFIQVPFETRWRVDYGTVVLTTSAVAGARELITRVFEDGTLLAYVGSVGIPQNPGASIRYNVGAGHDPTQVVGVAASFLPLPVGLELRGTDIMDVAVNNAQAGDFISPEGIRVREWIDA